jgi:guanine deaminase
MRQDGGDKERNRRLLRRAIHLSKEKMRAGFGGPFGAVVVESGTGKIIAEGWNQVTSSCDPTAHAEMMAIRTAAQSLDRFHLTGYSIYSSCEPCPMCLAAIYWAHLDGIYYANTRHEAAAIGFDDSFLYQEISTNPDQRKIPIQHIPLPEANEVFTEWNQQVDKTPY